METKAQFIPGAELAERFYHEAIRPILDRRFPGVPHSAGLIGCGSEVLGFDNAVSSDHHWGPRAMLFFTEEDHARLAGAVSEALRQELPHTFLDWPAGFGAPDAIGVRKLVRATEGPVEHMVEIETPRRYFLGYLGFDLDEELTSTDWLTFPSQLLRTIVAGRVFHDGIGLEKVRARFAWYPNDVWLYLLAASWARIGEEEHLVGRAGQVGDEIGAALIGGRLVRDVMRLCFLMEREYAPYPKWYGTAFSRLKSAGSLSPILWRALRAETWLERDQALAEAFAIVARMHNVLGVTEPLPASPEPFDRQPGDLRARQLAATGRPFSVIGGRKFTDALRARIRDELVRDIPFDIGGIDQWSDSTEVLEEGKSVRARLKAVYRRDHGAAAKK